MDRDSVAIDPVSEIVLPPLLMHCQADGMGATIKPMAAIHALDNPQFSNPSKVNNGRAGSAPLLSNPQSYAKNGGAATARVGPLAVNLSLIALC